MQKTLILIGIMLFTNSIFSQNDVKMDSLSYSLGVLIAQNVKKMGFEGIDSKVLAQAVLDVTEGSELRISQEDAGAFIDKFMAEKGEKESATIIEEGKKFLAENKKRKGVVTLPSGLQYEILKEGNGPKPLPSDKVTTHYHGTLIDGTVFDSSVERGTPATFPVNGVIQGWVEALQLMPEGSKWKLFIPYDLAYGERGAGADIKPYATLIFEIELLKIN